MRIIEISNLEYDYDWLLDDEGYVVMEDGAVDPFVEWVFADEAEAQKWINWWTAPEVELEFTHSYSELEVAVQAARIGANEVALTILDMEADEVIDEDNIETMLYIELLKAAFGLFTTPEKRGRQTELYAHSLLINLVEKYGAELNEMGYDEQTIIGELDFICDLDEILPKED